MRNAEDAKSRESLPLEPQLQRLENPLSINALNALRDGASCSDTMGCGRYVGFAGALVKGRDRKASFEAKFARCPAKRLIYNMSIRGLSAVQKYLFAAVIAFGLWSPVEAAPLSDAEAIALLKGADTRYCRRHTPVHSDADGYERAITHGQSLESRLTPELDRAASFTLVAETNLSRAPADHLVNFDRKYRFMANGQPLEFDYSVRQRVLKKSANGNFRHDSVRVTGCIFVPDKVTILSKSLASDGASVTVTYHETMRLSPLALFLNQVWSDGVDSMAVPRDHVAELRRLPDGSWRVEKVDGASLTYRPGETIPRSPVDSTIEQRSQERAAAGLKCALPGRREAIHLRILTPETRATATRQSIDPVKNAVSISDKGNLRLTWNGQPIDRVRLRQYLDVTAQMNPQPWLLIDRSDETPLACEVVAEIIQALRYNAPWFY